MDENRCRLCSKTEATTTIVDVLDEDDIHNKINSYLSLDVRKYDGLPTSICILCYGKLDNFHDFVLNICQVQNKFTPTAGNQEIESNIELENGNQDETVSFTYQDFETETKFDPNCNMEVDVQIPIKKYKRKKEVLKAKPTRKSNRFKPISKLVSIKKDACTQAGITLATDLENLKSNSRLKLQNLHGLEILALLPTRTELGRSISEDTRTSKSCLAKINLGVKTKSGEILMAPNSDSNSKQLIKLPLPRIST